MKNVLFGIVFLFAAVSSAGLQGDWKLAEMIYQGNVIPLPNPDLNLRWSFYSNGTERLYWDRGTEEFCERFAHFSYGEGVLRETVFAVNPKNAAECSQDPDMQVGKGTQTRVDVEDNELHLHMQMGEEELIYILRSSHLDQVPIF